MVQQFSCWLSVRNSGSNVFKLIVSLLLTSTFVYGQTQAAPDKIRDDIKTVQNAVNDVVGLSVPGWGVLQGAKGAYLKGYGIVLNIEVAFDPPVNPFSPQKSPEDVRTSATQKRGEVQAKLANVLKQKLPLLTSLNQGDSVAIILNILNTNPVYMPDMPSQIVLSAKKQDAQRVSVDEYR
jgi:hypothetical protein